MSKGRISERLRKRLNEGTMTPPSNPIETVSEMRLDEETEARIEMLGVVACEGFTGPINDARNALRSRIRHLVSEARKEGTKPEGPVRYPPFGKGMGSL